MISRAFKQFLSEQINERLKVAMEPQQPLALQTQSQATVEQPSPEESLRSQRPWRKRKASHIVKALLREVVDPKRIVGRDVRTYFGVLLDDNNRKADLPPLVQCQSEVFGAFQRCQAGGTDTRSNLVDDIFKYADRLRTTVLPYTKS